MSLDTQLDLLIRQARGAEAPPPQARARVREQLAAQLQSGALDPALEQAVLPAAELPAAELPAPARRWSRAVTWGVPAGVAIGAALWLGLRLAPQTADPLVRAPEPRPVLAPGPVAPAAALPAVTGEATPAVVGGAARVSVASVERDAAVAAQTPVRREARARPSTAPRPAPATATGPDLLAESQALARVQQALRSGQHSQALRLLGEQEHEFTRGALHEERAAARALALCGAGQRAAGERAAAAFVARYPESVLRARVQSGCASREPPK